MALPLAMAFAIASGAPRTRSLHRHIQLALSGLTPKVEQELERSGLLDQIGRQNIFPDLESALR